MQAATGRVGVFRKLRNRFCIPCSSKKNCNHNFDITFLILIRWSCASDMFRGMVPRYCGVVFAREEGQNVANDSVEFQGHEKKVVQLPSASSGLFRMYVTLDQVHRNACVFWHTPVENGFKAAVGGSLCPKQFWPVSSELVSVLYCL